MADVEKLSEVAMQLITFAGMAKSGYLEALAAAKTGDFEKAAAKLAEGDENFVEAHKAHFDVLQTEMQSMEPQISLLLTHAEDQLMGAETYKTLILELIDIYKKLQ